MENIEVVSVNVSEKKGTIKIPMDSVIINAQGIAGDAHAGYWHRQVSLLGVESIEKMQSAANRKLNYGEFAENITTRGFPLYEMKPLDFLVSGEIRLEVTQIGKKCHGERCTIFRQTGDCVMPKEGIFCRVISGGTLKAGDMLEYKPKVFHVAIITLSDRASRGEYEDKSGPVIRQMLEDFFNHQGRIVAFDQILLPDDPILLKKNITKFTAGHSDFIFTTGGTGIGPSDFSPDVIRPMFKKEIPGIMEMIRIKYGMQFPNALMSRSIAGVIDNTLVYVMPGSPKAVEEYLDEILKTVDHSLMMLHNIDRHG